MRLRLSGPKILHKGGGERMTAEHYIQEKERLSRAMNGPDKLMKTVAGIAEVLEKHNLSKMPGVALDVTVFTLETLHLGCLNLRDRQL